MTNAISGIFKNVRMLMGLNSQRISMYASHAENEQNTTIFRTYWKSKRYINKYVSKFISIDICFVLYLYLLKILYF